MRVSRGSVAGTGLRAEDWRSGCGSNQTGPLLARITGSTEGLEALLSSCGWQAVAEGEALPRQYRLTAGLEKGQN
ncbi:hypothetical protein [Phytobacter sp. V91]|uniref:hypothetical protein n=1 Tax=Phytobacter sp. V91 TaxID=3369425 RepID=UPI003F5E35BF